MIWIVLSVSGFLLSMLGAWLNAKKHMWCWPMWILANVVWIIYWVPQAEWIAIAQIVAYLLLNILGWRMWYKEPPK